MRIAKRLAIMSVAVIAGGIGLPAMAAADPLTPPPPNEIEYLNQLRRVFAAYQDPTEFRSDGELLELGRQVCFMRSKGIVGAGATLITPAINQLAPIYLCPN